MKVHVVLADHWEVAGTVTRAYASEEGANKECASLVNILLTDSDLTPDATAENWPNRLATVQEIHGAQYCYVAIVPAEVLP